MPTPSARMIYYCPHCDDYDPTQTYCVLCRQKMETRWVVETGEFTNPHDKEKDPERYNDWNDGFFTAMSYQFKPGAGDVIAGMAVRALLETLQPGIVKSLDKAGIDLGKGIIKNE